MFSTCSNPSTNSTFAVTPLVLTPLVRNHRKLPRAAMSRDAACRRREVANNDNNNNNNNDDNDDSHTNVTFIDNSCNHN